MVKVRVNKRIKFSIIILVIFSFFYISRCSNANVEQPKQPVYTVEFLGSCSESDLLNLFFSKENEVVGIKKEGEIYYPSTLEDEKILSILESIKWIKDGAKVIIKIPMQKSRFKNQVDEELLDKAVSLIGEKVTEVNVTISKYKNYEIAWDNAGRTHKVRSIKIEREKQE